jgi:hypothetical protein
MKTRTYFRKLSPIRRVIFIMATTAQGGPKSTGVRMIFGMENANYKGRETASAGAYRQRGKRGQYLQQPHSRDTTTVHRQ